MVDVFDTKRKIEEGVKQHQTAPANQLEQPVSWNCVFHFIMDLGWIGLKHKHKPSKTFVLG